MRVTTVICVILAAGIVIVEGQPNIEPDCTRDAGWDIDAIFKEERQKLQALRDSVGQGNRPTKEQFCGHYRKFACCIKKVLTRCYKAVELIQSRLPKVIKRADQSTRESNGNFICGNIDVNYPLRTIIPDNCTCDYQVEEPCVRQEAGRVKAAADRLMLQQLYNELTDQNKKCTALGNVGCCLKKANDTCPAIRVLAKALGKFAYKTLTGDNRPLQTGQQYCGRNLDEIDASEVSGCTCNDTRPTRPSDDWLCTSGLALMGNIYECQNKSEYTLTIGTPSEANLRTYGQQFCSQAVPAMTQCMTAKYSSCSQSVRDNITQANQRYVQNFCSGTNLKTDVSQGLADVAVGFADTNQKCTLSETVTNTDGQIPGAPRSSDQSGQDGQMGQAELSDTPKNQGVYQLCIVKLDLGSDDNALERIGGMTFQGLVNAYNQRLKQAAKCMRIHMNREGCNNRNLEGGMIYLRKLAPYSVTFSAADLNTTKPTPCLRCSLRAWANFFLGAHTVLQGIRKTFVFGQGDQNLLENDYVKLGAYFTTVGTTGTTFVSNITATFDLDNTRVTYTGSAANLGDTLTDGQKTNTALGLTITLKQNGWIKVKVDKLGLVVNLIPWTSGAGDRFIAAIMIRAAKKTLDDSVGGIVDGTNDEVDVNAGRSSQGSGRRKRATESQCDTSCAAAASIGTSQCSYTCVGIDDTSVSNTETTIAQAETETENDDEDLTDPEESDSAASGVLISMATLVVAVMASLLL